MGGVQTQILTPAPLNFLGPVGAGVGLGVLLGGGGGGGGGVPGTPTYMPQNDHLVALIILNTYMWVFEKNLPTWGPSSQIGGGGLGEGGKVRGEIFFPVLHAYLHSPKNSEHFEHTHGG